MLSAVNIVTAIYFYYHYGNSPVTSARFSERLQRRGKQVGFALPEGEMKIPRG